MPVAGSRPGRRPGATLRYQRVGPLTGGRQRLRLGPAVFLATLAATVVFFWWFLFTSYGIPVPG